MTRKFPFTLPERTLVRDGIDPEKGVFKTSTLLKVNDRLRRHDRLSRPEDYPITLSDARVLFDRGHMSVRFVDPSQKDGYSPRFLVFGRAASQMAALVLPRHAWTGLKELTRINPRSNPAGYEVASEYWDQFARLRPEKKYVWRTSLLKHNGEIYRAIRAVVSTRYNRYSNIEFINDILECAGHFSRLPILSWWLTDTGIRIRFLAIEEELEAFSLFDPNILKKEDYLPMIEIWNSEVGRSKVGLRGGAFRLKTNAGLGHWDEATEKTWRHVGASSKIRDGVKDAFTAVTTSAVEVVRAYKDAGDIDVEDPEGWLRERLGNSLPDSVIKAAVAALEDPKTTPGGKLASIIDALTIAASQQNNIYSSADTEKAASRLLERGREVAARNDGVIPAPKED